jgi:PAS domain S-box-containing protein
MDRIGGDRTVGGRRWRRSGFRVRNHSGGTVGVVEIAEDMTELESTREELRRERATLEALIQGSPAFVAGIDPRGRVRVMNRTMLDALGYEEHEVTGCDFVSCFVPEPDRDAVAAVFEDVRSRNRPALNESRVVASDGREFTVEWRGIPSTGGGNSPDILYLMGINVTETRRLESQLMRAQKLEAVGTLAGGIAHDFNNLLQAISGYTELLLLRKEEGWPGDHELREIRRATRSASELTERLLTFSRKAKRDMGPLNLNQQVRGILRILQRTIPRMVAIELDLEEPVDAVNADPTQVEQILMNLALNARDAMPDGGVLRMETRGLQLDRAFCERHVGADPGRYVRVRVSDTGHGIEPEVLEHIFEPFFTTKEPGRGSGLGLAMVYGIMKNHRGFISCRSEPERGTAFDLFFPVVREQAFPEENPASERLPGGDERILLVDDDRNVRELGEEILKKFGYEVLVAENGEQALALYESWAGRIDMVILDLIMPGMGGLKCIKNILEIDPHAKVLVSSGYARAREESVLSGLSCGFIRKPYDIGSMLHTIRGVLDQEDSKG